VIGAAERETLARLADVIVPNAEGMPAASEAGVPEEWIDRALAARPDFAGPLAQLLERAQGQDPAQFLDALERDDPALFDVLAVAVCGAYYMNPAIWSLLGYTGQQAKTIDIFELPAYIEEGLLETVVERGPIYRPTPE
jgi:hypothetical protein